MLLFLVRLQGKFEIDHSWEWKGLNVLIHHSGWEVTKWLYHWGTLSTLNRVTTEPMNNRLFHRFNQEAPGQCYLRRRIASHGIPLFSEPAGDGKRAADIVDEREGHERVSGDLDVGRARLVVGPEPRVVVVFVVIFLCPEHQTIWNTSNGIFQLHCTTSRRVMLRYFSLQVTLRHARHFTLRRVTSPRFKTPHFTSLYFISYVTQNSAQVFPSLDNSGLRGHLHCP